MMACKNGEISHKNGDRTRGKKTRNTEEDLSVDRSAIFSTAEHLTQKKVMSYVWLNYVESHHNNQRLG